MFQNGAQLGAIASAAVAKVRGLGPLLGVPVIAVALVSLAPAAPASAAAANCSVNLTYNTGGNPLGGKARCGTLTNGSKVRVKVRCVDNRTGTYTYQYGPWKTTANVWSVKNCDPTNTSNSVSVDYQTG